MVAPGKLPVQRTRCTALPKIAMVSIRHIVLCTLAHWAPTDADIIMFGRQRPLRIHVQVCRILLDRLHNVGVKQHPYIIGSRVISNPLNHMLGITAKDRSQTSKKGHDASPSACEIATEFPVNRRFTVVPDCGAHVQALTAPRSKYSYDILARIDLAG